MSGITPIQAVGPGEGWEALLAALHAAEPAGAAPQEAGEPPAEALTATALHAAPALALRPAAPTPPTAHAPEAGTPTLHRADPGGAVLPMAPVLLQPLALQQGPELRWRVSDAPAWRALFDDTGPGDEPPPDDTPDLSTVLDAASAEPVPAWAQALLQRLRGAAAAPATAACLRPAVQAWCVGLPVLLASPAGLACLQASRDASVWHWRRWPARWRAARPATTERWWAVRLGLGPQGRPRTLRELGPGAPTAPGQVSCELRLGDVAPGIAHWTAVLVQAPAAPSLRALLAAQPSLPWLLCNQALWPQEAA